MTKINNLLLSENLLANIYLQLEDKQSRDSFALTCKSFNNARNLGERNRKIHDFIQNHYQIIQETSSIQQLEPSSVHRLKVILLTEFHMSAFHRSQNSKLVSLLWNESSEIYLESKDGREISEAPASIRNKRKCWDISFSIPEMPSLNMACLIGRQYTHCFSNEQFNFANFLEVYQELNKGDQDNLLLEEMEEVCKEGESCEDVFYKSFYLLKIANYLRTQLVELSDRFHKSLDSFDELRSRSLKAHLSAVTRSPSSPVIFIAGESHLRAKAIQDFVKSTDIYCLALKPNNKQKSDVFNSMSKDMLDCLESEFDGWSCLTSLLKLRKTDKASFIEAIKRPEAINPLKEKMKDFQPTTDPMFHFWVEIPYLIYLHDSHRLIAALQAEEGS